jgi:sporulation protein YlmC with PRC-barrel domain
VSIAISELYGKRIISNEGKMLGEVKGVMLNLEEGTVSHLLLTEPEILLKSTNPRMDIQKGSIAFKRVKKISETVIVGRE